MSVSRVLVVCVAVGSACGPTPVTPGDDAGTMTAGGVAGGSSVAGGTAGGSSAGGAAGGDAGGSTSGGAAGGAMAGGDAGGASAGGAAGGSTAGGVAGGTAGGATAGLTNVTPPAFFGPARVFGTVTVVNPNTGMPANGVWQPNTGLTFIYQWELCSGPTVNPMCTPIAGATQPTYRIEASAFGRRLGLRVTASDGTRTASALAQSASDVAAATTPECVVTTTTRSPGQVLQEGGVEWTAPSQALTADGMGTTAMLPPGRSSQVLRLSGFGFSLPPQAVVTGVRVELRHQASVAGAVTYESIRFANPTRSSQLLPLPGTTWPVTAQTVTVGAANVNPLGLLESTVNSPDFRLELTVRNQARFAAEASIDVARVIIDYTTGTVVDGNPAGVTFSSVSGGAGEVAWTMPENARAADGTVTESVLTTAGRSSQTLRATNWGLTLPAGATPSGVILRVRRRNVLGSGLVDRRVALVRGSTTVATWPSAQSPGWFSPLTTATFGSTVNRWMGQPSAADVTASDFGVELAVDTVASGNPGRPAIDEVLLSVVHTPTSQTTTPTSPTMASSFEPRVPWANPENAAMQDSAWAIATFSSALVSQRLVASGFNFGLPAGAFVTGVQVQVRKSASVLNAVRDETAQLRLGPVLSVSRANPNAFWFMAFNTETSGGPQDRWGLTNELSAAAVSAPDAAFILGATTNAFSSSAQVDVVQVTVHWCPAP